MDNQESLEFWTPKEAQKHILDGRNRCLKDRHGTLYAADDKGILHGFNENGVKSYSFQSIRAFYDLTKYPLTPCQRPDLSSLEGDIDKVIEILQHTTNALESITNRIDRIERFLQFDKYLKATEETKGDGDG